MEIKESIYELLKGDYNLCLLIATTLGIRVDSVQRWAYRGQYARVGNYRVVKIIMKYANLTEDDFFEMEEVPTYKSPSNN